MNKNHEILERVNSRGETVYIIKFQNGEYFQCYETGSLNLVISTESYEYACKFRKKSSALTVSDTIKKFFDENGVFKGGVFK